MNKLPSTHAGTAAFGIKVNDDGSIPFEDKGVGMLFEVPDLVDIVLVGDVLHLFVFFQRTRSETYQKKQGEKNRFLHGKVHLTSCSTTTFL